ncbi:MAG: ABC transporter permease [bacterium]|nr:ABC transporter permease [bacterium]MXZ29725.1 ABC transporter permease [Acidimicrobiia bacterium]MDE0669853.1 ABC transporter permease [bacterium]MYB23835.1 ABC transporter permease [Acidimicrobiia bacterium]MYE67396.1 ABC transporter permease [Acidimicrobiia bacterium]
MSRGSRRWAGYLLRRVFTSLLVILGVVTITFVVSRLVPSDPASLYAGARARPEQVEQVRADLNLDAPVLSQYVGYLGDLARGDMGISFATKRPIAEDLRRFLPATLELALSATALAVLLGVPAGVMAASRHRRLSDTGIRLLAVTGVSMPVFWSALILQLVFAAELGWLPLAGRTEATTVFAQPTGMFVIDSLVAGDWGGFVDVSRHLVMPVVVMAAFPLGLTIRLVRGTMLEVLGSDYIEAATVARIPRRTVLWRLALKNALLPALTVLGLTFAYSISSAFLVEAVFGWPGLGKYLTDAIVRVDFPVITAAALAITVIYVLVNLALDLLQARLDPRVELA